MPSVQATAAIVTATTSLVLGVTTAGVGYFSKRKIDRDVAYLTAELGEARAERDAVRDYEYGARKHLYAELQPLLFQHAELCESAYDRIVGIATYTREGHSLQNDGSPLRKEYYLSSTIFRLFAPLAVFKLIQARITGLDVALEPRIRAHYALAKHLFEAWNDGRELAAASPTLSYLPEEPDAGGRRNEPAIYSRQHVWIGTLDRLARALTVRDPDGRLRHLSYGEFEDEFANIESDLYKAALPIVALMRDFDPITAPVLWRILLAQAHLHRAVLKCFYRSSRRHRRLMTEGMSETDKAELDWRPKDSTVLGEDTIDGHFRAVHIYLEESYNDAFVKWS